MEYVRLDKVSGKFKKYHASFMIYNVKSGIIKTIYTA